MNVGQTIPDFTGDSQVGEIDLHEYIDGGWAVIFTIPNFFARLKRAVLVSDGSASVEVISGARVPVAKILAHGQRFDVTHEFGEANEIALHHRQVQTWARRWANSDPAIW